MKSYLVEFENLVTKYPILLVFHGSTEESVHEQAMLYSMTHDYIGEGIFDMYPIYRNSDGLLELGEVQ